MRVEGSNVDVIFFWLFTMELQEGKWGWIDVDAGPFLSSFVHLEVILFKEFTFQAKKQNKG